MSNGALLGPNTAAPRSILRPACLLCAGEDRAEFLAALDEAGAGEPSAIHSFRGYEFWRFEHYCTVLSGIGTGALEPLLWEILRPGQVERIVLVGTAGSMPGAAIEAGRPHLIEEAWPAGTGIDALVSAPPLRPRWPAASTLPSTSSASTDFYYAFGPKLLDGEYPLPPGPLHDRYREMISRNVALVEMEVAQFYFFCERFGNDRLGYVAVKAPANAVGDAAQHLASSSATLSKVVNAGLLMLTGQKSESPADP